MGGTVQADDPSEVDVIAPGIAVQKTVNGVDTLQGTNGTIVVYSLVVTNTGDVALTNVVVLDAALSYSNNIASLAAGAAQTFAVTSSITADLTNIVNVIGYPPVGVPPTNSDPAVVDRINPGIGIVNTVGPGAYPGGELATGTNNTPVTYWFVVSNTGDVALTSVVLTNTQLGVTTNLGTLIAGQSVTVEVASAITVDLTNTAAVVGTDPVGGTVQADDPSEVDVINPAILIFKTVNGLEYVAGTNGSPVVYSLLVTNSGDVILTNVVVQDTLLSYSNNLISLGAGQSITLFVNSVISGDLTNMASVIGYPPVGVPPTNSDTAVVDLVHPGYLLSKVVISPTNRPAVVTENIVFSLTIQNTGDVTLVGIPVQDIYETNYLSFVSALPAADDFVNDGTSTWADIGPLPAGASTSIVVTYQAVATSLGLNRTNTVTAAPTTPPGFPPVSPKTNTTTYAAQFGWLGDTVWVDLDSDGQPDEDLNAQGLNGIKVRLYSIAGGVTNLAATTTTFTSGGRRGYYLFTNLVLGLYQVEVDLTTVPSNLDVITTARRIDAELTPNGFFINADFGFIADRPTEVSLMYFRGAPAEGGVSLTWATAVERENLGYHIYRAATEDGTPARLTTDLIPGTGTGEGRTYQWLDETAAEGGTYFYWLEDVEYDGDATRHGPVRVHLGAEQLPGVQFLSVTGGLHLIRATTLAAAGLPVYSVNADELALYLNGEPAALYSSAEGRPLRETDAVLVYVPAAGASIEVALAADALRMQTVYAGPSWDEGQTWMGVAENGRQLDFVTGPEYVRYLLADFAESTAWVVDVSDPAQPVMLVGVEMMQTAQGIGLYLSYSGEGERRCLAVTPAGLQELKAEDIQRK